MRLPKMGLNASYKIGCVKKNNLSISAGIQNLVTCFIDHGSWGIRVYLPPRKEFLKGPSNPKVVCCPGLGFPPI